MIKKTSGSSGRLFQLSIVLLCLILTAVKAEAFCGFYVAKADASLFNKASQVVLVRDGDRTVITMANDFQGEPREFAMVVPVPTFIGEDQIKVVNKALIDHVDSYTAPRLAEYYDASPCVSYRILRETSVRLDGMSISDEFEAGPAENFGVRVEAEYTVGEYDIKILSAKESDGLESWLRQNGYKIPNGATEVLSSYIKQKVRFFVAKVNLEQQSAMGFNYLRPLQISFSSPKFMLPIRLGTVNADGPQDLFVYALTRKGRVETTNYRTVKLPTGNEIPPYVTTEFDAFYTSMFDRLVERENMRAVFLEYAWNMNFKCDPCVGMPLAAADLRELGVDWLQLSANGMGRMDYFITRLHVRYDAETFPQDLMFQETADNSNFQGRYVIRHPWQGNDTCEAARDYRITLRTRQEEEARMLAAMTGWDISVIRNRSGIGQSTEFRERSKERSWWDDIRNWFSGD